MDKLEGLLKTDVQEQNKGVKVALARKYILFQSDHAELLTHHFNSRNIQRRYGSIVRS